MTQLFRRIRYLLNRARFDRDLANDLEFHREMAARAGRTFGNTLLVREEARDAWGWTWIDRLSQDLRYAARTALKSPGFTLVAILILGIGVGVNVAAFGFFNMILLRPLPIRAPATLLRFDRRSPANFSDNFPYPETAFFREHTKTLSAVLAMDSSRLALEGEEKQIGARFVSSNYFTELGATATLGRLLDPSLDEGPGAENVVVLSHGFWQRHFASDPLIAGKTVRLNGKAVRIVGVAAAEFSGLGMEDQTVWVPIAQKPYFIAGANLTAFGDSSTSVQMWGRLQRGVAPPAAEAELKSLAVELRRQHPQDIWERESFPSHPGGYARSPREQMYPVLAIITALCLLILIVACSNLGSLLLAKGVARDREMAIRASVGAGRARLIRQLFTESLLLAFLGAAAGLALGTIVLRSLLVLADLPEWLNPAPDWRVILFAGGVGFASAIMFGLAPAFQLTLRRHRSTTLRRLLIGGQVAASCVLLILSGLLIRALERAASSSPGFGYDRVISIDPGLPGYTPARAHSYFDTLESRLRAIPGVASVAVVSNPPLGNRWTVEKTQVAGRAVDIHINHVNGQFFETMQIPLLRGRSLRPGDQHAIVVSESLARLQWPGADPLGKLFPVGQTVVGVAGDAHLVSPEDSDAVEVYQLADGDIWPALVMLVKTSAPPEDLLRSVAAAARSADPKLFPEVGLMRNAFREKVGTARNVALAVSVLGSISLLLACLGIVGLVAYAVSQRTKEIGIRMALGAEPAHVLTVVLRQFSIPVVAGLLAGAGLAAGLSSILRQELYGVSNLDPVAYVGAIGMFVAVVTIAALVPARQALRIDPLRALRYE
jgi:predicted permease